MNMTDTWDTTVGSYDPGESKPGFLARLFKPKPRTEGGERIIRRSTYPKCRKCGATHWVARANAEAFIEENWRYVRQPFECVPCGAKRRFVRRLDRDWTSNMDSARKGLQAG